MAITEQINPTDDMYSEGFNLSLNGPTISLSSGRIVILTKTFDAITLENKTTEETTEFNSVEFDIEDDPDFETIYDLYLLEDGQQWLERTVIDDPQTLPYYRGTVQPIALIMSVQVQPRPDGEAATYEPNAQDQNGTIHKWELNQNENPTQ